MPAATSAADAGLDAEEPDAEEPDAVGTCSSLDITSMSGMTASCPTV
jgi:hypothetical protein